ncbi:MAG: hypothetical protein C5T88_03560 [Williamsoniiplasma luminosum]|uniref:Uncharacterized protein n=1 Tax=Williamsoniiplasma luminosum TaxID=214888 RepID=A0A2S0NKT6_9MOLU|nr:MAG: hypothetical protein C5T88_03560 [Williamsoniiplasma luminosum]
MKILLTSILSQYKLDFEIPLLISKFTTPVSISLLKFCEILKMWKNVIQINIKSSGTKELKSLSPISSGTKEKESKISQMIANRNIVEVKIIQVLEVNISNKILLNIEKEKNFLLFRNWSLCIFYPTF